MPSPPNSSGACGWVGPTCADNELFATLATLTGHYIARADLRRATQVLELSLAGLEQGRQWFRPVIEARFGVVAWLRGEFDRACSQLERAAAGPTATDQHQIDAVWFQPSDPTATAHIHLALTHVVRGDMAAAEADLAHGGTPGRTARLPKVQWRTRLRALRGDLAARRSRSARPCRGAGHRPERAGRAPRLGPMAAVGGHPATASAAWSTGSDDFETSTRDRADIYRTFFDAVLGQLLIAVGEPEQARERRHRLQLAEDTEMHFYDAELLRLRARLTPIPMPDKPTSKLPAQLRPTPGCRACSNCVPPSTISSCGASLHMRALAAALGCMPPDSTMPEVARARACRGPLTPSGARTPENPDPAFVVRIGDSSDRIPRFDHRSVPDDHGDVSVPHRQVTRPQ